MNRYYIGYSRDLETRLEFHKNSGVNKFTGKSRDWKLFFRIDCESETQARAIESHLKKMKSKVYIENLKQYPELPKKLLERYMVC